MSQVPSEHPAKRKLPLPLILVTGLLVVSLVVWAIIKASNPTPPQEPASSTPTKRPSPTSTPSKWHDPVKLRLPADFDNLLPEDLALTDMILFKAGSGSEDFMVAVDLNTPETLWQWGHNEHVKVYGDDTGFVATGNGSTHVINPRSGQMTWYGDQGLPVVWAGNGVIITTSDSQMCGRSMSDPSFCQWSAPEPPQVDSLVATKQLVFGDGNWINTGDGVRDLATGERAPFGLAATLIEDAPTIHFTGAPDRIFRVESSQGSNPPTYQPWNTESDTAISPAVPATHIIAPAGASYYIAETASGSGPGTATARKWETGKQQWKTPTEISPHWPSQLVNGFYVHQTPARNGSSSIVALDPLTGKTAKWPNKEDIVGTILGNTDTVVFVASSAMNAAGYDPVSGEEVVSFALPNKDDRYQFQVIAGHMIARSDTIDELYVLKPTN